MADATAGASQRKASVDELLGELGVEPPSCQYGYPSDQLYLDGGDSVFRTKEAYAAFNKWMYGQTVMLCQGPASDAHIEWLERMQDENPGLYRQYHPNNYCEVSHGPVVYSHDLYHYLLGSAPID